MQKVEQRIKYLINKSLKQLNGVKFNVVFEIVFSKPDEDNNVKFSPPFPFITKPSTVTHKSQTVKAMKVYKEDIIRRIDRFTNVGSGWAVSEIRRHFISIAHYDPLSAEGFIPLPNKIQNSLATINIQNNDDKCFMYCLGRVLDPKPEKNHLERVSKHLKDVCADLGLDKIKMPVSVEDIPKIETKFKLTINLFGYKKNIYPIRTTMERYDKHMDLLYIEDKIEETSHYVWIKNFNKLMNKITKNCKKKHF